MRFMIIPMPADRSAPTHQGALDEKIFASYMKFNEDLHKAGVLIASEGLNPEATSVSVALSGGKRKLVDGPYTEAKELIGGFYLIQTKTREEAIGWATKCPMGLGGDEVLVIHQMTELSDLPPHLQALILKSAPTWSATVMKQGR